MHPFLRPLALDSKTALHLDGVSPANAVLDSLLAVCILAIVLAMGIATVLILAIGVQSAAGAASDAAATVIQAIDASIQWIVTNLRSLATGT